MEIALKPEYDSYNSSPGNEAVLSYRGEVGAPVILIELPYNGDSGPRTLIFNYHQFKRAVDALR